MNRFAPVLVAAQVLAISCWPQKPASKKAEFDDSMTRAYKARMFSDWIGVQGGARRAAALLPHRPDPYLLLAQALCTTGDTTNGMAMLGKAVERGSRPDAIGGLCRPAFQTAPWEAILKKAQQTADAFSRARDGPYHPETPPHGTPTDLQAAAAAFAAECTQVHDDYVEYGAELRLLRWVAVVNRHISRLLSLCHRADRPARRAEGCIEALRAAPLFAQHPDGERSGVTSDGIARVRDEVIAAAGAGLSGLKEAQDVVWAEMAAATVLGRQDEAVRLQTEYVIRFPHARRARLALFEISNSCASRGGGRTERERAACQVAARDPFLQTRNNPTSLDDLRQWYAEALDDVALPDREFFARRFPLAALAGQSISWMRATTADGKAFDITALSGRPLLIEFWATSCAPCFENMNVLKGMRGDVEGRVELVGINVDGVSRGWDGERLRALAKKEGLWWPQIFQARGLDDEIPSRLGIRQLPVTIFADREQVIRSVRVGPLSRQEVRAFIQ